VTHLIAGELIKVRTTRTALGFGIAALLLTVASVLITTLAESPNTLEDKRAALAFGGLLAIFLLIYGAVGATGEYRHRTLAPAVLIAPDRFRLVIARSIAYGLTAVVFAVAIGALTFALGIPLLGDTNGPDLALGDYAGLAVGGVMTAVFCALIGVGAGTLVRNQVATIVGLLVWLFVAEPLVGLINDDFPKYTIGIALGALGEGGNGDSSMLTAAFVLGAWAFLLSIAGALVDRRRDVD
jgi:ABC-2 type transport system permease protein